MIEYYSPAHATTNPILSPSPPSSPILSNFNFVSSFCWNSIIATSNYSDLCPTFRSIDNDLCNFLFDILQWKPVDCCFLHQLSLSTIRQIAALPPSTFDDWEYMNDQFGLDMSLHGELQFLNWWPCHHRRCSTEVLSLTEEACYTSHLEMNRISENTRRCSPHKSRNQMPRLTHRHHPPPSYRQPTQRHTLPLLTDDNTDKLSPSAIATLKEDTASTINAPEDSTIRPIFDGCTFIDASHLPPDDPHYSSRSSSHSQSSSHSLSSSSNEIIYKHDKEEEHPFHDDTDTFHHHHDDTHHQYEQGT